MTDVVASACLSSAIDALRTLIANLSWFRTWTNTATINDALLRVKVGEIGYPVKTVALVSDVATLTTAEPHNLSVSDTITVEGVGAPYDGKRTVATVPNSTSLTFSCVADNEPASAPNAGWILPTRRPFAALASADGQFASFASVASGAATVASGVMDILLEADVSSSYVNDPRNARVEMENAVGGFIDALRQLQGTADFIVLNTIAVVDGPYFSQDREKFSGQQRFERWQCVIRVTWGLES